jgi:anthranilate/para-aminobenzoate synthase component II
MCNSFNAFKKRGYTVNGVYLAVNNLPYFLRTQIENILLVMVTPGPGKPNAYQYDQMMEPIVNDLIALQKGVSSLMFVESS